MFGSRHRSRPPVAPPPWQATQSSVATEDDILACFRLLLGRNPNQEEWAGHSRMAGQPLAGVVSSYLRSLEFSRRGLMTTEAGEEIVLAALPGFSIYCDVSDPAVGSHIPSGAYEPEIAALFRRLLAPGMGVIDIGANMGYFSMLSASLVGGEGFVLAVEPNRRNARLLESSRQANGFSQMRVAQVAAGADTGLLALHTSHSTGTASRPEPGLAGLLAADTIPSVALDGLVPDGQRIDFIKIDVDGGEYPALLGCRKTIVRDRPLIISEFSPGLLPGISGIDGETYLRWFGGLGYTVAVIEPDGTDRDMGQDWSAILQAHRDRGTDHIDILARPG